MAQKVPGRLTAKSVRRAVMTSCSPSVCAAHPSIVRPCVMHIAVMASRAEGTVASNSFRFGHTLEHASVAATAHQ